MPTSNNKISDDSQDKKYFILTPQIVWAYCRSPFDFTLWNVIKMIAGETGECFLSTEDLSALSMMSTGKVSECRQFLLEVGLIQGECRKDPGYPQPVWHLSIPDLWLENVTWRQSFDSLKDRIDYKLTHKNSLHVVKASPREGGSPPREGGSPPRETKKIPIEKPKGKTKLAEKSALLPETKEELLLFEKLAVEFAAKGYRPPKKFPSLACRQKYNEAVTRLNGNSEIAITRAMQRGIIAVIGVTDFIFKYEPDKQYQNGASKNGHNQKSHNQNGNGYYTTTGEELASKPSVDISTNEWVYPDGRREPIPRQLP